MSEILDATAAAEILQCSNETVYQMAKAGELGGRKIGREWRFRRSNVEQAIPLIRARKNAQVANNGRGRPHVSPRGISFICPTGPVPGFRAVLKDLEIEAGEFAFRSGLPFAVIDRILIGESVEAMLRARVLETVVALKRQKRERENEREIPEGLV